uniref:Calpain-B n=1 Tax=Schistosoma haematobium TaxID=6185 RepID=A0A095A0Z0_SCHHA
MGRKYPSETPRSAMRGQCNGSSVLVQRTHKSPSLECSADWFKQEIKCQMERGGLFEDPFMPATDSTIKSGSGSSKQSYRWLRPVYLNTFFPTMGRKYPSETPRSAMRGQCNGSSVLVQRTHKSPSLECSADWFKQEIKCQMERGGLFEDPFMPATDSTIKSGSGSSKQSYRWLRPVELSRCPRFVADGVSRFDIKQGELGNCWVIAALASLSMYPELFNQVVPPDQSFEKSSKYPYVGMFWFRFWQFGDWYDVVVDDRLPTRNGHLVFMHSADPNEFWSALLEKAYAKLVSSYDALRGGCTAEAMEDFTGGLTELLDLGAKAPTNIFGIMEHALNRASLMACSIDADPHEIEANGPLGLILGHAYSVTDIRQKVDDGLKLVSSLQITIYFKIPSYSHDYYYYYRKFLVFGQI